VTDVDLDRLADYLGGALDGTPEAATVAHLVASDPRWAQAHVFLLAADLAVRADLGELAAESEPVPADVRDRISSALAAQAGRPSNRSTRAPAHRADQRRRRWIVGLSAAAAAVAIGLGAVIALPVLSGSQHQSTNSAAAPLSPDSAEAGKSRTDVGAPAAGQPPILLATGTDYTPITLGGLSALAGRNGGASQRAAAPGVGSVQADNASVPGDLGRLLDPTARANCLNAIIGVYGGSVSLIDYARFQGAPAMVVLLSGVARAQGRQWAVVVGARCGENAVITDERYHIPVG